MPNLMIYDIVRRKMSILEKAFPALEFAFLGNVELSHNKIPELRQFYLKDVVVLPQTISAAVVKMELENYTEPFNYWFHSHHSMATNPSQQDIKEYNDFTSNKNNLRSGLFFMHIGNYNRVDYLKVGASWGQVPDVKVKYLNDTETMLFEYERSFLNKQKKLRQFIIDNEELDFDEEAFKEEIKLKVKREVYTPKTNTYNYNNQHGAYNAYKAEHDYKNTQIGFKTQKKERIGIPDNLKSYWLSDYSH